MANVKPFLYGVGAFALAYGAGSIYRQYSLIKSSTFKIKDVQYGGIDISGLHLNAKLELQNNSNISIEAYNQVFDVYVNNTFVGKITDNKPAVVPSKGMGTFSYSININPQQAIKAGLNILKGGLKTGLATTIVRLKGTMKVKTSGILLSRLPIDIQFKLGDYIK